MGEREGEEGAGAFTYLERSSEMNMRCDGKSRWWNINNPYQYRDDNLLGLGFKSYRSYLKSDLWKSIRERVLVANRICAACARRSSSQVHHRSYDPATLRGDDIRSLSAVCSRCHAKGERPWAIQDRQVRLMRMNKLACRARKKAERRHRSGFIPDDAKPIWHYGKTEADRKRQVKSGFSNDMAPRLVKP